MYYLGPITQSLTKKRGQTKTTLTTVRIIVTDVSVSIKVIS
jgi:hypothetical protein